MFDEKSRQSKAMTMVIVLSECVMQPLGDLRLLNVGGSAGIIDNYLADHFENVTSVDIDTNAVQYARSNFKKINLNFEVCDAMDLKYPDSSFDVVICSQVYEHVEDANILMSEIFRVLKPTGLVYFAAGNKIMFREPHYNLPLLSMLPLFLANMYMKISGKGEFYYEKHLTYWGLRKLVSNFEVEDYTKKIIFDPVKYNIDYMVKVGSFRHMLAKFLSSYLRWMVPGYIWILKKKC